VTKLVFITHPSVVIDEFTPIDQWNLSEEGIEQAQRLSSLQELSKFDTLYSSPEPKSVTVALMLSDYYHKLLPIDHKVVGLKEIHGRRFIPPEIFKEATKMWFDNPTQNPNGWESLKEAQKRIVFTIENIMSKEKDNTVVIVGHGGTGTLLKCSIKKVKPVIEEDQSSQGSYFVADWDTRSLVKDWQQY